MAKVRVNHFAAKTISVSYTVDWESILMEVFIALLLGVFAYMGYMGNIALLLFPCAIGSFLCFFASLHTIYLTIKNKQDVKVLNTPDDT